MPTMLSKNRLTFNQSIAEATDFKKPIFKKDHKLYTNFARSVERFDHVASGLQRISRDHLRADFDLPRIETTGADVAARPYEEVLAEMESRLAGGIQSLHDRLAMLRIGRIDWFDDESCCFQFYDMRRAKGILTDTLHSSGHVHQLVKAKLHPASAPIRKPKKADELLAKMPAPLLDVTRIVTGMEVVKDVTELPVETEPTAFGNFVQSLWSGAKENAAPIAAGVGAATLGIAGIMGVMALTAAQVAIADPAIVIGEFCLFGWED